MKDDQRKRLEVSLHGVEGRPFGDLDAIEKAVGREVPAAVNGLCRVSGRARFRAGLHL
jgi:hypothetical protein